MCFIGHPTFNQTFPLTDFSDETFNLSVNFCVLNEDGELISSELMKATDSVLYESNFDVLNDKCLVSLKSSDLDDQNSDDVINNELIQAVFSETKQKENGRLVMPILWNPQCSHLLGSNFELAHTVLLSNVKKLRKNPSHFAMVDNVFREQVKLGIIEPLGDAREFAPIVQMLVS